MSKFKQLLKERQTYSQKDNIRRLFSFIISEIIASKSFRLVMYLRATLTDRESVNQILFLSFLDAVDKYLYFFSTRDLIIWTGIYIFVKEQQFFRLELLFFRLIMTSLAKQITDLDGTKAPSATYSVIREQIQAPNTQNTRYPVVVLFQVPRFVLYLIPFAISGSGTQVTFSSKYFRYNKR